MEEEVTHSGCYIQIASYITARARSKLADIIYNDLGMENIVYGDTDSVITFKPPSDKWISNTELGKMKVEKVLQYFKAVGPKMYFYKDVEGKLNFHAKGFPKSKLFEEFYNASYTNPQPLKDINHVLRFQNTIIWKKVTKINKGWCEKM